MLTWYLDNVPKFTNSLLFCKIVPNVKKLGLLDAGDGWLRRKYEEIEVIQYEDWVDTVTEHEALDAVSRELQEEDRVTDDVEPGNEDELRSRILDAADACISRYGVQKTTIDDVAKKARVARATLYKYVPGGRDELVLAVLLREAERNIDVVLTAMQRADTLEDSLTAGVLASVDRIRSDDHLAYLFSPEIVGYASRLDGVGDGVGGVQPLACSVPTSTPATRRVSFLLTSTTATSPTG